MPGRWFSHLSSRDLDVSEADYTLLEVHTVSAISNFMIQRQGSRDELMHCLQADGKHLVDTSSGPGEAPLTDTMREALGAEREIRFWHNHPSCDSLSNEDWRVAGCNENVEVVALTARGSIYAGRIPKWDECLTDLLKQVPFIAGYINIRLLTGAGLSDGVLRGEFSTLAGHVINCELGRRELVSYGFHLSAFDTRILEEARSAGHLKTAEDTVALNFDRVIQLADKRA